VTEQRIHIGSSGLLLVSHLAAYGMAVALETAGESVFVAHDLDSPDLEPLVITSVSLQRVVECVRASARACQRVVDADIAAGRPTIWARATDSKRALEALSAREHLLDELQDASGGGGAILPMRLIAGLGAPVTWGDERTKPSWGATVLDGVAGNSTSDFVRGVLRRTRPVAEHLELDDLRMLWSGSQVGLGEEHADRTGWAPPGTRIHLAHQWLAALGLCQLPVGLTSRAGRTPCSLERDGQPLTVQLPVCPLPVSAPRLRSLLALRELSSRDLGALDRSRLRALGIGSLLRFPRNQASNAKMVAFNFARGEWLEL
jgi:hypothetical protein